MELDYTRDLEWFKKVGDDFLVDREDITSLSVDQLKDMLGIGDEDDPELFGLYKVPEELVYKLQPFTRHKIDTESYKYYIGSHSKD